MRSLASRTSNDPNLLQVQPKDERAEKKYSSSLKPVSAHNRERDLTDTAQDFCHKNLSLVTHQFCFRQELCLQRSKTTRQAGMVTNHVLSIT